jgi:hypothetical protein
MVREPRGETSCPNPADWMLLLTLPGFRLSMLNRLKASARISSLAFSPVTRLLGRPNALLSEASMSL